MNDKLNQIKDLVPVDWIGPAFIVIIEIGGTGMKKAAWRVLTGREVRTLVDVLCIALLLFVSGVPQKTIFRGDARLHSYGPAAGGAPQSIVIMLHHANAGGDEMIDFAPLMAQSMPHTLFLAPDGITPSKMIPGRFCWFDRPLNRDRAVIRERIVPASNFLRDFIPYVGEKYSVAPENIAVVAYSQGAVLMLETLSQIDKEMGVAISFAGYGLGEIAQGDASLPILLVHGVDDTLINFREHGQNSARLSAAGYKITPLAMLRQDHSFSAGQLAGVTLAFLRMQWPGAVNEPARDSPQKN